MNKTDKEYVDAQIESIEKKFEARLNNAVGQVVKPNPDAGGAPVDASFPVSFTQQNGKPVFCMDDTAVRTIAWKLLLTFYEAKEKLLKEKREEEGQKTQEEWYADIYNKNVENWKLLTDCFQDYIGKHNDVKNEVAELKTAVSGMRTDVASLTKSVNEAVKNCKPSGVFIFGRHISGWYFFPFMFFVFIFLGLFGYETYYMRDKAIQANVKLQVIREDFGHHPAVARTFQMLDSLYDNPIPPKVEEAPK